VWVVPTRVIIITSLVLLEVSSRRVVTSRLDVHDVVPNLIRSRVDLLPLLCTPAPRVVLPSSVKNRARERQRCKTED
jgi:hypothetical protein